MINMSYSIFYSFVFILYVLSLQSYSSESLLHPSGRLWPSPPHSPRPVAASTWSLLSSLLFQVKKNTSEDDESIDGRQGNKKSLWGRLLQRKTAKSSPSANNESDSNTAECNSEGGSSSSKEGGNSTATSPTDTNSERSSHADEEDDQDDPSSPQVISVAEMQTALSNANNILSSPPDHITALGWKLVHNREHEDVAINATRRFSLYKRRKDVKDGGSVEYLMTGEFSDISPVSFLSVQLDQAYRKQWDSTMKDMSVGEILLVKLLGRSVDSVGEEENDDLPICNPYTATLKVIKDVLYYRTKWPWPMKDRDYVLARRCRIFDANNSMVLVSRSIEVNDTKSMFSLLLLH